jgi:2-phospho-L-lactate/phosphoenolpyruvate guanylyltransferase
MHILIPCKNLNAGKSRLSGYLDPRVRREFCERLLNQTLKLSTALAEPARVKIVTDDLRAAAIASQYGVTWIRDQCAGLNAALEGAKSALLPSIADGEALLILPIDLPFASADVLAEVISCPGDLVIAPDHSGTGTNLLLMRSMALRRFHFAYGPGSYAAHIRIAEAHKLGIKTFNDWHISFDIDEPAGYAAWCSWQRRRQRKSSGLSWGW